jgi:hypothetical protein
MRDCPKSTPPPETPSSAPPSPASEPWNELAAFRETALRHFTRPEDAACLRRLGEMLTEGALEQAHLWPRLGDSETVSGTRAAVQDLLHTAHFLTSVGDARHLSNLTDQEGPIARAAARASRDLRQVARTLLAVLEEEEEATADGA